MQVPLQVTMAILSFFIFLEVAAHRARRWLDFNASIINSTGLSEKISDAAIRTV